ncbi:T9SS type A sorting domain-containing protein, partial [candidate division GN15 bacterium]|nr:T9SS type A sorting domain-containing protein [candidate division GN15 bacterium]
RFALHQNYPNPFNPSTQISFTLPVRTEVTLEIFNILGRRVTTLVDDTRPAGTYTVEWNGADTDGNPVATGIYFYRLHTDLFMQSRKMILMK